MQKEIIEGGRLLNASGSLNEAGWARTLIREYRRSDIKANPLRIKEWDYYLITDGRRGLALTIADNSYMGMYSVSWLDFEEKTDLTKSVMTVLPLGRTGLPSSSASGITVFRSQALSIGFDHRGKDRILYCVYPDFRDHQTLSAEIILSDEPEESMVIMTPYKEDQKAFYYNQKINCMTARGYVRLGDEKYDFTGEAMGVLDWGRGVWTYANTWYWSSASGMLDGHRFGFNLGYGFGDTSAASENVLFLDGRVHKLDRLTFHIPQISGRDDFMSPWQFTSSDGRFEAVFTPILNRKSDTNVLIIESDQNQVFGTFTGKAVLDDGTVLEFRDFFGFAEKVRNRW